MKKFLAIAAVLALFTAPLLAEEKKPEAAPARPAAGSCCEKGCKKGEPKCAAGTKKACAKECAEPCCKAEAPKKS